MVILNYNKENEKIYRVEENKINITNVNRNFVTTWSDMLDLTIDKKRFLFVHGDIKSSENHVYDITSIDKELFSRYDYYMFGHTHIPFVQYHNGCCIVNPGSIGQPRDYTQQPSYVVLDTNSLDISIKKIIVDVEGFCNQISLKSYNEKLINILKRENNE